jgi:hypothetical protein
MWSVRGNRRRRQGEDVHRRADPLEELLVLDAETLLLVDDDQAQVLETDVGLDEPVGADDDVDRALGELLSGSSSVPSSS